MEKRKVNACRFLLPGGGISITYHQSHVRRAWLKMVPLGQRNEVLRSIAAFGGVRQT